MVTYLSIVLGQLLRWLGVTAGALYAGVVVMRFRTDGPHYRLNFDPRDPAWSAVQLVVWLGVKALAAGLRFARGILNMLLEASAQVGEWFIRLNPNVEASIRSRFLV